MNLPLSLSSGMDALCFGGDFQGKWSRASQIGKSIHTLGQSTSRFLGVGASRSGTQPITLAVSITAPSREPCARGCLGSSDSAPASSCGVYSPVSPLHAWPCPGAPLASPRVPAARGLTPSAGSEISLHQVNCQTAQSLKLNIKAVAHRHRAIPPRSISPQEKAILAV